MSADKFNATLRNAIITRARNTISSMGSQLNKMGNFSETSELSTAVIRASTDKAVSGYESIVSRGGISALSQSFIRLSKSAKATNEIKNKSLAAAAALEDQNIFDAFVSFVKEKYADISPLTEPSPQGFMYEGSSSGDIRIGRSQAESERDLVVFKNLDHGDLKQVFVEFLSKKTNIDNSLITFISKNLDGGHLTGVFNARLRKIFGTSITQSDSTDYRTLNVQTDQTEQLDDTLTKLFILLADADYLSSNIAYDIGLFSNTTKNVYGSDIISVSAELQISYFNQEAGRKLVGISKALNRLIESVDPSKSSVDAQKAQQAYAALFKNFKNVAEYVESLGNSYLNSDIPDELRVRVQKIMSDTKTVNALIETEGSDSVLTAIARTIANTIRGTKLPTKQITNAKITEKIPLVKKKSGSKKSPPKLKTQQPRKPSVSATVSKSKKPGLNLTNLQNLINQSLIERVKANMGRGERRDVLNLRTGRFAESVKVERMSQSREGMITAFYSYMKNPYATFSQGGRQSSPKSRDPKLLIARSIREIATAQVANRLRSVSL